jgi:N-carbamoylputrescine amidase
MQDLKVAAVSMNSPLGQPDHIWRQITHYVAAAAEAGADVVLFPELVIHGHCAPDTWERAESVPTGPSTTKLDGLARKYNIYISAGLSEKSQDVVFNTQVLVGPLGFVGKQRKLHTSRDETLLYKGGSTLSVFDIGKAKVATVICYDNELPEVPRLAALKGAEVILMPHAGRASQWSDDAESQRRARRLVFENYGLYRLRAKENACFCVVTDQAGRAGTVPSLPPAHENQPHHPGGALIIGPNGKVLAHAQVDEIRDEMIVADLKAALFNDARSHPNFTLRTRRPELFGALASDHLG